MPHVHGGRESGLPALSHAICVLQPYATASVSAWLRYNVSKWVSASLRALSCTNCSRRVVHIGYGATVSVARLLGCLEDEADLPHRCLKWLLADVLLTAARGERQQGVTSDGWKEASASSEASKKARHGVDCRPAMW
eukprot:1116054-Pyramimonas_sp.AAC.1